MTPSSVAQWISLMMMMLSAHRAASWNDSEKDSILIAAPDPIMVVTYEPTSPTTTNISNSRSGITLDAIKQSNTQYELYSLHSIVMLLILGCSGGILISICCAVLMLVCMYHANRSEPKQIRIFRGDGHSKQAIQRS